MSPKIYTNKQRAFLYDTIARAEGNQCIVCWIEDRVKRGPPRKKLIIEHADNDEKNSTWSNLHLFCYSHNKTWERYSIEKKKSILRGYSDQLARERERAGLPTWSTVLKDMIPYESGSPEMKAHKVFYPRWKKWVNNHIKKYHSEYKRELVRRAAKAVECSIQTSRNYLELNTSEDGPYKETFDDDGNVIITFLDWPVKKIHRNGHRNGNGRGSIEGTVPMEKVKMGDTE